VPISREFIETVRHAFPHIENEQWLSLEQKISQFQTRRLSYRPSSEELYLAVTTAPVSPVLQGDIFDNIPIPVVDADGALKRLDGPAVLLSTSCDFERDDFVLFAKCFTYSAIKGVVKDSERLRRNGYYQFFSFGNSSDESKSLVADFTQVATLSRELVQRRLSERRIRRMYSLSLPGYFFFITKLYTHLLRVDTPEGQGYRQ
jgi:hypothetical protein